MSRHIVLMASAVVLMAGASVAGAQEQPPTPLPAAKVIGAAKSVTVQNDRGRSVTLYLEAGRLDRAIGTVAPGATTTLELPAWVVQGQRSVKLVARAEGEQLAAAEYSLPLTETRPLGVLVPPRGGLPFGDSMLVTVPRGMANEATVTVNNERDGTVTVYAEQGLLFVPLGEVSARSEATLVMPESLLQRRGAIRVFTRAGTREMATAGLTIRQGDRVSLIVM
jgi:hypothetical protein